MQALEGRLVLTPYNPFSLSVSSPTASEADGTIDFIIQGNGFNTETLNLSYATADGAGANAAISPSDFTTVSGVPLILAPGDTAPHSVSVTINNDSVSEPNDESFVLNVTNTGTAALVASGIGTIQDDDSDSDGDSDVNDAPTAIGSDQVVFELAGSGEAITSFTWTDPDTFSGWSVGANPWTLASTDGPFDLTAAGVLSVNGPISETVDQYFVTVFVTDNAGLPSEPLTINVYVQHVTVDIVLNGMDETVEESPGDVVKLNELLTTSLLVSTSIPAAAPPGMGRNLAGMNIVLSASAGGSLIKVWGGSGRTDEIILGSLNAIFSTSDPHLSWFKTVYLEPEDYGEFVAQLEIQSSVTKKDQAKAVAPEFDLDAKKVNHNVGGADLDESLEESQGAYLPLNNDDDDYDIANTPDKDQDYGGTVPYETDLLPIVLHAVNPASAGGNYRLEIPAGLRVWDSAKTTEIQATTDLSTAADTTLYVEALTTAGGIIKVNWVGATKTINDVDRVKVSVFEWLGPLNVPGYSKYQFTASGGSTLPGTGWTSADGGTVIAASGTVSPPAFNATIYWTGGPVVGKAVFQAHPDYVWDLEVNVVEITFATILPPLGAINELTYSTAAHTQDGTRISSNGQGAPGNGATTAILVVDRLKGAPRPHAAGTTRGLKFIEIGFIQNVRATKLHADYLTADLRVKSSIEDGNWYLDTATDPDSTVPWLNSFDDSYFLAPSDDVTIDDDQFFRMDDFPKGTPTGTMVVDGDTADRFEILYDYDLYFSVRTKEAKNNSEKVFTQRATASWWFNASGNIDEPTEAWKRDETVPGVAAPGQGGANAFSIVTNGSQVPVTTGSVFNNLLKAEYDLNLWITEDLE